MVEPDLVVLIGDAAVRGGSSVVRRMAANRATDILPIAVVSNEAQLEESLETFEESGLESERAFSSSLLALMREGAPQESFYGGF